MSNITKIWIIIAASFVIIGGILFVMGMNEKNGILQN